MARPGYSKENQLRLNVNHADRMARPRPGYSMENQLVNNKADKMARPSPGYSKENQVRTTQEQRGISGRSWFEDFGKLPGGEGFMLFV